MRGPGCWLLPLLPPLSALLGALAARTKRCWDLSRGAETHAAAGGSAGPSRPAQPEVSARRRGGRAGAAGEEAGLGHLPGRRRGLPSARRPLPFLSRGTLRGGRRAGRGWSAGLGPGERRGSGPSVRPSLPRGASQLLLPLSWEAAAPRSRPSPRWGPGEPDVNPGGAESEDSDRLLPSRVLRLAWAKPRFRRDAACSLQSFGALFGQEGGQPLVPGGCPSG